ncbi:protein lifeguard 1-like isoform X2 [Hemicordylus capensis]|uniref:protein lifeguard 1-like isoform X2 n=1 Tax=Hemicordylus capensis TaxID=884348 RepID=UPI0023020A43|nr:protein lifeguard 1-like isoform X2 [Hemicordylus capensis]XP_053103790.1 protein lifeguard 1-like isoform X2 [Hemicordylus capensis]
MCEHQSQVRSRCPSWGSSSLALLTISVLHWASWTKAVFVLLTVQLPVVLIMTDMLRFVRRFKSYVATYAWIIGAPIAVFFISLMVLIWFGKIRIKNPWDLIALPILILIFKNIHNIIPIPYSNEDILIPLGITAALLLVVLIFSIKIKCNVTSYFWVLFAFLMALLTTEILSTFIQTYILDIIFSFLEVLLFTCLLALTTQLIWENRLQTLSNFEYTLAAGTFFFITLLMYFDILNIVIVLKD